MKKAFLKISQNSQGKTCARVSFLIKLQASAYNFIKKETLAQVFSCEFREIFKKPILIEQPWWLLLKLLLAQKLLRFHKLHSEKSFDQNFSTFDDVL